MNSEDWMEYGLFTYAWSNGMLGIQEASLHTCWGLEQTQICNLVEHFKAHFAKAFILQAKMDIGNTKSN